MVDYPICVSCLNFELKHDIVQTPRGATPVKIALCKKFPHPISGEPVPANEARQDERFCGFKGKGYEKKLEDQKEKVLTLIKTE